LRGEAQCGRQGGADRIGSAQSGSFACFLALPQIN